MSPSFNYYYMFQNTAYNWNSFINIVKYSGIKIKLLHMLPNSNLPLNILNSKQPLKECIT